MKTLILYTGSCEKSELAYKRLRQWSQTRSDVQVEHRSVHYDPAEVVRLGITSVPALVLDNEVLAQGAPDRWLTDAFLRSLARR